MSRAVARARALARVIEGRGAGWALEAETLRAAARPVEMGTLKLEDEVDRVLSRVVADLPAEVARAAAQALADCAGDGPDMGELEPGSRGWWVRWLAVSGFSAAAAAAQLGVAERSLRRYLAGERRAGRSVVRLAASIVQARPG